jgi:hypothetical protein
MANYLIINTVSINGGFQALSLKHCGGVGGLFLELGLVFIVSFLKANLHMPCRTHAVPMPFLCHAVSR